MTRTPRLGDDLGHLVNLSLGTAEGTELCCVSEGSQLCVCVLRVGGRLRWVVVGETYPLLRETTGTLVLGVAEEFDDALLVGGKAEQLLAGCADGIQVQAAAAGSACAHSTVGPPPIAIRRTQRPHG